MNVPLYRKAAVDFRPPHTNASESSIPTRGMPDIAWYASLVNVMTTGVESEGGRCEQG